MIRVKVWFMCAVFFSSIVIFSDICSADNIKQQMYEDLDFIRSVYHTAYTPEEWKNELFGWDLNAEILNAKEKVDILDGNLIKGYHNVLKDFFYSMKDYHVGFNFCSTEESFLPFMVKGTNGKYFIANIIGVENDNFGIPFNVGDEILKFGEKSTKEAVNELISQLYQCNSATDTALAAMFLTMRSTSMALDVPNGPITIRIKHRENNQIKDYQLQWFYYPEIIKDNTFSTASRSRSATASLSLGLGVGSPANQSWINRNFSIPLWNQIQKFKKYENSHSLGARESYIPSLGKIIWQTINNAYFHAYIYLNEDSRRIGYIRIPDFGGSTREVEEFAYIIRMFEWFTDALVIDQINNPGGKLTYLYALASIVTNKPLKTPLMKEKIYQDMVYIAFQDLRSLSTVSNDEEAKALLGDYIDGYPVTYELVKSVMEYDQFIIDQWNTGNRISEKFPILGIQEILPHTKSQYTKPVLLIVNSLAFSGGDFFPAILQDNKRVTIMGTTTAGAGGYVRQQVYPNLFGLSYFTFTGSIAYRLNDDPIENLGVTPDIIYHLSENDLQNNYPDYRRAINTAVNEIID